MKRLLATLTGLLLVVGFILSTSSCASTTIINSNPQGAKVYMNQSFVGTTPYTHTDTKIVGSTTAIKLTMEGYEDFNTVLLAMSKSMLERSLVGSLHGSLSFG